MNKQSNVGLLLVKRVLENSRICFDEVETLGSSVVARVTREGVAIQLIVRVTPSLAFMHTAKFSGAHDDVSELTMLVLQSLLQKDEANIRMTFALAA
jgi:hypothetical protein